MLSVYETENVINSEELTCRRSDRIGCTGTRQTLGAELFSLRTSGGGTTLECNPFGEKNFLRFSPFRSAALHYAHGGMKKKNIYTLINNNHFPTSGVCDPPALRLSEMGV